MQNLRKIIKQNSFIDLGKGFYSNQVQEPLNEPYIVHHNKQFLDDLGLSSINPKQLMDLFNGTIQIPNNQIISMNYAGHQFGQYVQQLGDGRGVLPLQPKRKRMPHTKVLELFDCDEVCSVP